MTHIQNCWYTSEPLFLVSAHCLPLRMKVYVMKSRNGKSRTVSRAEGARRVLASILALWMFLLCGLIHLTHNHPPFHIEEGTGACHSRACNEHWECEASAGEQIHHTDNPTRGGAVHRRHPERCPACDFLSNTKCERTHYDTSVEPERFVCATIRTMPPAVLQYELYPASTPRAPPLS